jgi:hypothetical protein
VAKTYDEMMLAMRQPTSLGLPQTVPGLPQESAEGVPLPEGVGDIRVSHRKRPAPTVASTPEPAPTPDEDTAPEKPSRDTEIDVSAIEGLSEVGNAQARWEAQKGQDVASDFAQHILPLIPVIGTASYSPTAAYEMTPHVVASTNPRALPGRKGRMVSGQHSAAGTAGAAARNVAEHIGETPRPGRAQIAGHPDAEFPDRLDRIQGNERWAARNPKGVADWAGDAADSLAHNRGLHAQNVENALDNMRKYLNSSEIARALQGVGPVVGDAATTASNALNVFGAVAGAVAVPVGFFQEFHEGQQLPNLLKTMAHIGVQGPLGSDDVAPEIRQLLGKDQDLTHRLWAEGTLSDEFYGQLMPEESRMRLRARQQREATPSVRSVALE